LEEEPTRKMSTSLSKHIVKIKLVGVLRGITGRSEVSVKFKEPVSVSQLLQELSERLGPTFKRTVIDPELNDPRPNTLILVNDVEISALQGLKTKIGGNDTVVVIPVSHGG